MTTEPVEPEDSNPTLTAIYHAREIAEAKGHEFVTLEHLLASLLEQEDVIETLKAIGAEPEELLDEVNSYLDESGLIPVTNTPPDATPLVNRLITLTIAKAVVSISRPDPKPVDLLLGLVQLPHEDHFAVTLLLKNGVDRLSLTTYLSHGRTRANRNSMIGQQQRTDLEGPSPAPAAQINNRQDAEAFLVQYAVNLNEQAKNSKIDPLIGRETEVAQIIQITARRTKNNVAMVGEPGVGKTAIAEGLALKIVRGEVPEILKESVVWSLDVGALIAGARFRGDFEERMKQVLHALDLIPNAILFIDEIHTIMGAGASSQGTMDVANLLKPALAKGNLRCIGSTTLEEFRKHFEKDRALLRRFKRVDIHEPSVEDTKLILRGLRSYYEAFHGVTFTEEALDAAVDLTHRYVTNALLPDKAIDVIDNAGARQRVAPTEAKKAVVGLEEIEVEVSKVARIPAQTVAEDEATKLARLGEDLRQNVVGQDRALVELEDAVFIARSGLREPNKPSGAYLFTGPTGTGKTETARTLASTLGVPLIKYDMSEYMEKHSVSKLIGAPPGYVGFAEGNAGSGKLTNDIDANPYCVLLLDEIEKAHPDVFNILLQVMDDGALTNSNGKRVDFRNVILIMTSNAGAQELQKNPIGFRGSSKDADEPVIKRMFSPEFRNRLDAIVKFDGLKPEHMEVITRKFVNELGEMASKRNVRVVVESPVITKLSVDGYDPKYGARPLKRVIADTIKKPLSRLMVTGPLKTGGIARVRLDGDKIVVNAE